MGKQIIYLIFIVAYLAYTYYTKSQKKKNTPNKPASQPIKPQSPKPKSFLEKMILGEEFFEPPATHEPVPAADNIKQKASKPEQELQVIEQDIKPNRHDIHENPIHKPKLFDLKQAIIYNALLDRPYV